MEETPPAFECDPEAGPSESALRRLTKVQYENTLNDLLSVYLSNSQVQAILTQIAPQLNAVPGESVEDIGRVDHNVAQEHADGFYLVSWTLAELLTSEDHLGALLGVCATDNDTSNDTSCIDDFIDDFGPLVLRRPLLEGERAFYLDSYGAHDAFNREAFTDLLIVLFNAPHFLHHIEDDSVAIDGRPGLTK